MRLLSRASRGRLPWLAALVWQLAAPTILVSASQPTFDPSFKYPRHQNMVFYEGETVNVTYRSDWSEVSLYLFCKGSNSQIFSLEEIKGAQPYNGSELVLMHFNTTQDSCWFNLRNEKQSQDGDNSVHFAINKTVHSPTTLGLASPTATTTTKTTTTTHSGTSTATSSSTGSSGGGLSTGATAGIAVGVVLGVLVLTAALLWYWLVRRRRSRQASNDVASGGEKTGSAAYRYDAAASAEPQNRPLSELPGTPGHPDRQEVGGNPMSELPGRDDQEASELP